MLVLQSWFLLTQLDLAVPLQVQPFPDTCLRRVKAILSSLHEGKRLGFLTQLSHALAFAVVSPQGVCVEVPLLLKVEV